MDGKMHEWMEVGWINEWKNGRMMEGNGWMDASGQMDGEAIGRMDDGYMGGQVSRMKGPEGWMEMNRLSFGNGRL